MSTLGDDLLSLASSLLLALDFKLVVSAAKLGNKHLGSASATSCRLVNWESRSVFPVASRRSGGRNRNKASEGWEKMGPK